MKFNQRETYEKVNEKKRLKQTKRKGDRKIGNEK